MAEGHGPSINFIVTTLRESKDPQHMRFKSKFTEENVRKAIIELGYADKEGKYEYSDKAMHYFGHLGKIADQIIKTFPESKSSSESKSSESKTKKKRRRRRNKSAKGGLRRSKEMRK